MDSVELTEWLVYERMEPFSGTRIDANGAQLAMILANVNRGKDAAAIKFEDCMIRYDSKPTSLKDKFVSALSGMRKKGSKRGADGNRKPSSPPHGSH